MSTKMGFRIVVMVVFCISLLLPSCTTNSKKIKIALMLGNMKAARWQKDKKYFLKEAEKLGCEAVVLDADYNQDLQYSQAEDLIKQGYNALVIGPVNSSTGASIVRMAKDNGVKTIAYDGIIGNCQLDYMISFNNEKIGKLMAQYALSKVQNGNFIILGGDKTHSNAKQIRNGEDEVLAPYIKDGRVNLIYNTYIEGWSRDEAYVIMQNYLRLSCSNRPDVVLGSNDKIADGIIQAFLDAGVPLPLITGQDASIMGLKNIMTDKQTATIYKPIQKLAGMAATMAYKAAIGDKIEYSNTTIFNGYEVPTIFVDVLAVDKNNIESTVIADGFEKMEDILK
jgi:D-xylose transport system substrate-binding protein